MNYSAFEYLPIICYIIILFFFVYGHTSKQMPPLITNLRQYITIFILVEVYYILLDTILPSHSGSPQRFFPSWILL